MKKKKKNAAPMQTGDEFEHFFKMSLDMLCIAGLDGYFKRLNPAWEKTLGFSRKELLAKPYMSFVHAEDRESTAAEAQKIATGRDTISFENRYLCKDGNYKWLLWNASAPPKQALIYAIARDITERKRAEQAVQAAHGELEARVKERTAELDRVNQELRSEVQQRRQGEEALRESETRLQFALDTSQMGEWELDLVEHTAHRSLTHDRIFGYETLLPEWTYEKFMEHVVPEDRELVDRKFRQAMEAQSQWNFECRIVRCDQAVRWIWACGRPRWDANGKLKWLAGIVQDITERKRAEEEIRKLNEELEARVSARTAELEASNKELEAFTYSVSHDLRAPLRHIDGFSKLLTEEHNAELSEEAREYVTLIRDSTREMGQLVDDLLNLARVGRKELSVQVTGLDSLVEEVVADLTRENAGRTIEWKVERLPFVECDPGLIKQVFANLLSNAVKYTRPRERAVIELGAIKQNGQPVIFVRDNGVGFNMKNADKLFGVFQRLHRAEDFEGTGVGLATVQRIIHKHGGRVWAEAELDRGATFYFTLGTLENLGPANSPAGGGQR